VENSTIVDKLCELGVDYAQGYHIAQPAPLTQTVAELLITTGPNYVVNETDNSDDDISTGGAV
jgi:predicted signal transduction protein with EAL and GGDEF domain